MSFFDQPYYASTKAHMSRIGIWPEQSKYVKICLPLTMFAVTLTLFGPTLVRLHDAWGDINVLARGTIFILMEIGIFFIVFNCIQYADDMKLLLMYIKIHWQMVKNTPAVIILDKYNEKGRYMTVVYSTCTYVAMILYFSLCLSPVILDIIDPMNETRPKMYVVEVEYGVDADKYYWFIISHTYVVFALMICTLIAVGTMHILWAVHACAVFEIVGFNLELIADEYTVNMKNTISRHSDWHYRKICECIVFHVEAIRFANLVENRCSRSAGVALAIMAFSTGISGVQALMNWKHPAMLTQHLMFMIGQIFHLYLASIPGQALMDHSGKVHLIACVQASSLAKKLANYDLDWQSMPVTTQKLLIPILMRSNKPCRFTAGKVYDLSMETFALAIRTTISYFMIFMRMI